MAILELIPAKYNKSVWDGVDVTEFLKLSNRKLYSLIERKILTPTNHAKTVIEMKFKKEDVLAAKDALLKSATSTPASTPALQQNASQRHPCCNREFHCEHVKAPALPVTTMNFAGSPTKCVYCLMQAEHEMCLCPNCDQKKQNTQKEIEKAIAYDKPFDLVAGAEEDLHFPNEKPIIFGKPKITSIPAKKFDPTEEDIPSKKEQTFENLRPGLSITQAPPTQMTQEELIRKAQTPMRPNHPLNLISGNVPLDAQHADFNIGVAQAERIVGCSSATFHKYAVVEKKIPWIMKDGARKFRRQDLESLAKWFQEKKAALPKYHHAHPDNANHKKTQPKKKNKLKPPKIKLVETTKMDLKSAFREVAMDLTKAAEEMGYTSVKFYKEGNNWKMETEEKVVKKETI